MRILMVKSNDAGQRLDKFLQKSTVGMPVSLMYKLIRTKKIKVNRKRAEPKQMLCDGDSVQCFISEEFFSDEKGADALFAVKPNLNIIYEDENILLLNKPAGVLCPEDDENVVRMLSENPSLRYCPHGRPFIKTIPKREVEKYFDR